jgi:CPA2 family monovalent cation:H+ antiporter-2
MTHPALEQFGLAVTLLAVGAMVAFLLRIPALPIYLLMGVLVGPRLDVDALQPLPDLGLVLLLFTIGFEFGPDRLVALSGRVLRAGLWDAVALPVGVGIGLVLGLDLWAALLLGSALYISSSAVIAKLIIDLNRAAYPESEVVLGILVFEDLLIAVLLALAAGQGGPQALLGSLVLIIVYLIAAKLLGPRLAALVAQAPGELLILLGTALTIGTAELFYIVGASESVGAFLAGILAASLGLRERLQTLFGPVRDLAAALFFLTVGATARTTLQDISWIAIGMALAAPVIKLPLNYGSGAAAGLGVRGRLLTALYLIPRGEFTLVVGAIALQTGTVFVGQVAVLLVLITVPLGTLLIQIGPRLTHGIRGRRLAPILRVPRTASESKALEGD